MPQIVVVIMTDLHVHAENRLYKVYGAGPASFVDKMYAHMRGLGTLWLLSIIPFVIVYINTFNVQYGLTVSFFVVLIELGKHLSFYEGPPRAFLVLDYYPPDESGYEARACNEESEDTEETASTSSCEGNGGLNEESEEVSTEEEDQPIEDQETSNLESPSSNETTEKNETMEETPSEPVDKED